MNSGFKSQCVPTYRILTEAQIKEIHWATLEVLETVGVRVLHQEGVQLLKDAGCRIKEGNIVQIPSWLIEDCIRSTPSQITMYNRLGQAVMNLEGNKVHFGLGTDLLYTYDLETGELRPSRLQDVKHAARTADYFEEIDFIGSSALPQDVPINLMYVDSFKAQLENSSKPIFFTAGGSEDLAIIIEMAAAVSGGEDALQEKPFLIHYAEPTSPLSHSPGAVNKLFLCADKRVPVNYTPGMLSGASGPVTLAGAITVANAEALSGIALHQLRAKGAPIISGFGVCTMDMLTATSVYGCPEYRLTLSACADIYHYYGIPMWGTAGVSDSNCLDQQAGIEAAISLLMAALDGANLVHDIGYLGQGLIGSPASIVMGAEIISYVKRVIRGFDIGPDWIGMDVIRQVGPGGNFLLTAQTLKLHQQEHWRPLLANRDNLDRWTSKGNKTYGELATEKAIQILETHKPKPLADDVREAIRVIREEAEKTLADIQFVA
jgi:trimethylamine--corrinoid protein Co-methyltransferase